MASSADSTAESSSPSPSENAVLSVGCYVMVQGLTVKPYLNGRIGQVTHQPGRNGRYGVQLDDPWDEPETSEIIKDAPKALKRSNIVEFPMDAEVSVCDFCERTFGGDYVKMCAKCRILQYCSKECQAKDWKMHKNLCTALRTSRKETDPRLPSIQGDSQRAVARVARIDRFLDSGDDSEAEKEIRRTMQEFDKKAHNFHVQLGNCLTAHGRFDDALATFRHAVQQPLALGETIEDYSASYTKIGGILQMKRDPLGAIDAYRRALELNPDNHQARRDLDKLTGNNSHRR